MDEWISVHEEMPGEGIRIELKDRHGSIAIGLYDGRANCFYAHARTSEDRISSAILSFPCVTHWRPFNES